MPSGNAFALTTGIPAGRLGERRTLATDLRGATTVLPREESARVPTVAEGWVKVEVPTAILLKCYLLNGFFFQLLANAGCISIYGDLLDAFLCAVVKSYVALRNRASEDHNELTRSEEWGWEKNMKLFSSL